jgi:hypothetical protein
MAHRPEDVETLDAHERGQEPDTGIVFRLIDVEPFAGLIAAVARYCMSIGPEVYAAHSPAATEALSDVQGIMWRLEHANVERG